MKCDMKMMVKAGLALAAVVVVAYAALPGAREWISAVAPSLFFLICPVMMLFMMKGMQSCDAKKPAQKDNVRPMSFDSPADKREL
ncbi:DUF2933 domain-containing protein [Pollutimonas sp. H1-120]|uniref:DUF2933 domain-containing protein n=1 Tax=Pollutimonas sp. H1-120 TaxID=3148824 RepID=UPI003B51B3BB